VCILEEIHLLADQMKARLQILQKQKKSTATAHLSNHPTSLYPPLQIDTTHLGKLTEREDFNVNSRRAVQIFGSSPSQLKTSNQDPHNNVLLEISTNFCLIF